MTKRRWNWWLWIGFLISLLAVPSYLFYFDRYPVTRDIPWVTFVMLAIGAVLLVVGISRAFGKPLEYRGKIFGPILGVVSLVIMGLFGFLVFHLTRQLPASNGAPRVGQKAPEFVLPDTNNQPVSLSSLLSTPMPPSNVSPKGVVLIFYRGYW
jgi:hypothetical protein